MGKGPNAKVIAVWGTAKVEAAKVGWRHSEHNVTGTGRPIWFALRGRCYSADCGLPLRYLGWNALAAEGGPEKGRKIK